MRKNKKQINIEPKENKYFCKECGKQISSFCRDMSEYVYKLRKNGKRRYEDEFEDDEFREGIDNHTYHYYCSYSCYNKALKKREEHKSRENKVKRLNAYNGVLTLREIDLIEDICLSKEDKLGVANIHSPDIKSKEDFFKFLDKNGQYLAECIEYYEDLEETDHISTYVEKDILDKVNKIRSRRRT